MVVAIYAVFALISYVKSIIVNKNVVMINEKIKTNYVLQTLASLSSRDKDFESENLSFFMNDLKLLETNYWRQIFSLLGAVVTTVGTLGYAFYSDVKLALIFIAFMVIPSISPKLFSKSIQKKTEMWSQTNKGLSRTVRDLFHGAQLLKRYKSINNTSSSLNQSVSRMEKSNAGLNIRLALSNSVIGFLFFIFSYVPMGIGVYWTIINRITLSQFVAIQYSSTWILNGFNTMVSSYNTINGTKQIRKNILEKEQLKTGLKEKFSQPRTQPFKELTLENVSCKYDEKAIFSHVDLGVKSGEKVLISGPSGIGKSSLIRLILKELKIDTGTLRINGGSYSQEEAYDIFAVVEQSPVVFEKSILYNVTLGNNASDENVVSALLEAGLPEFGNYESLHKIVGENGRNLSGGQLKRLEIARALFFNHKVLLVDEGTASLDVKTSIQIHKLLLTNNQLTIIEVDHHIPDQIRDLYTSRYILTKDGLQRDS
ncbi:ATP-binding cassette domain-containing protein [Levilactobacillus suantsaii]|uniref:ABC transporter ATP-binding protein n=1 Tax=Levilactobacillus suantsaii TaxID=2292255 RepID=A0A4Q0VH00_9LACO|nr:ABC transporter ATP-binding protein [Levilactobacillus suantsaii]RXI75807.1 ABC transporter ATP-binding protein [Levilactobacillus suantsaii]